MKKINSATAILFLISCGFFIWHTTVTEEVSRQVFWGILLLLQYIKGTQKEIEEKIKRQNKEDEVL